MKAMVCRRYGGPEVLTLEDVGMPEPSADQVRVRVHAAAVNDYDLGLVRGSPFIVRFGNGFFRPRVRIPGCDVAGVVEAIGPAVTRFRPGDPVLGDLSECGFGAFAEYVCAPEGALVAKPATMTFEQAAALPQAAVLAMQGLFEEGRVRGGQRVLLNGAGGGVGTLGLQMLAELDVEVTCVDSACKLDRLRDLGADHVVDYRAQDFSRLGQRYDVILDTKTNRAPGAYLRALEAGGTYVTVGGSMGRILQLVLYAPWASRRHDKRLRMVVLAANRGMERVTELFEAGRLVPVIDRTHPLPETVEALRYFESAAHHGKVIISIR
jgi:NADPH:quinone reductase-like Zn-dependent oxidoreductase